MSKLHDTLITQDLFPKLIGKFLQKTEKVIIAIIDKNGLSLNIVNSNCSQIADTTRWSWSIKNMPENIYGEFKYKMTSNWGEIFEGKFLKEVKDGG